MVNGISRVLSLKIQTCLNKYIISINALWFSKFSAGSKSSAKKIDTNR